jgi:hypothetical protein
MCLQSRQYASILATAASSPTRDDVIPARLRTSVIRSCPSWNTAARSSFVMMASASNAEAIDA